MKKTFGEVKEGDVVYNISDKPPFIQKVVVTEVIQSIHYESLVIIGGKDVEFAVEHAFTTLKNDSHGWFTDEDEAAHFARKLICIQEGKLAKLKKELKSNQRNIK